MSTRSFNIIRRCDKLYCFWCHWDGNTVADTILEWTADDIQVALNIISSSESAVSSVFTRQQITTHIENLADSLINAIINGRDTDYYLSEMRRTNFVKLYESTEKLEIPCFTLPVRDIPEISYNAINDYCIKRFKRCPINDFEVINLIDFDNRQVAMEREIYDDKIDDYRKITLDSKFSFDDVRNQGIETLVGLR